MAQALEVADRQGRAIIVAVPTAECWRPIGGRRRTAWTGGPRHSADYLGR
jgi:hypothetical protein